MTLSEPTQCSSAEQDAVRQELHRILASPPFQQSQRRQRFLKYVVEEALAGRADRLKAYTIAVEVFERPAAFDPLVDPIVRIEAGRLRDKLREYDSTDGHDGPVRIELPKGSYVPLFVFDAPSPVRAEAAAKPTPLPSVPVQGSPLETASHIAPSLLIGLRSITGTSTLPRFGTSLISKVIAAGLVVAAAIAAVLSAERPAPQAPGKPSIAVIPFDNIGGDETWKRFADGMTEDIITDLSHSKDLVVIARNSTTVYRNKPVDIRQIGRDLNVKYVLEGSIQPMNERIRVTAQLIEAAAGSHVWSERYDRPANDLFAVQNEVTQRIAATLGGYEGAVAEAERRLVRRKPPSSLSAFDTYLLAMEAKHKVTKESLAEAESLFNKAIDLDPQLARAYVGLVDTHFYMIDLGLAPSVVETIAKMAAAGERAVAIDPNDGKTHYALGLAALYQGKREQALTAFERAEALSPSDADQLLCIAWSLPVLGHSERAVVLAERALMLNPYFPDWYNQGLSYVFFFGGQLERSIKYRLQVKSPLALDHAFMAMSHAILGRTDQAIAAAAEVKQLDPDWTAERYLSEAGGSEPREAEYLVGGARKAGLQACVAPERAKDMPNLIRVESCDEERKRSTGG